MSLSRHELEQKIKPETLTNIQSSSTQIEETEQLKSEYLSMAVHEFRNPLTNIIGWTQLLRNCSVNNRCSPEQVNKAFN